MGRRKEFKNSGDNPRYDFFYDHFRYSSDILHGRNTFGMTLSDLRGCQNALASLIGNSKDQPGYYKVEGKYKIALLPSLELDEKIILLEHENYYCQRKVNSGFRIPTVWSPDLLEKKNRVMARIDVCRDEITAIEKKIAEFEASKVASENEFLQWGPMGGAHGGFVNGIAREIIELDGQRVDIVNRIPTIVEETSPYRWVLCCDYYDYILTAWRAQRKVLDAELLIRLQEQARAEGRPIPKQTPIRGAFKIPKSALPKLSDFPMIKLNMPETSEITETVTSKPKKSVQLF